MKYEKLKQLIFLKGTKSKILDVLENNKSINFIQYTDQNNNTALHYAISYQHCEVIQKYLQLLNDYSLWREKYGNISDELIRYKANLWINTQNNDGLSALHYASIKGSLKAIQSLENAGARLDLITNEGLNAFSLSAKKGKIQSMLYFDGKIDANATDLKKCTALHWATYENEELIVKYLVAKHRTQIDFKQQQGRTALHLAVLYEREKMVETLLIGGANRFIKDKQHKTALDYAETNQNERIIELLTLKQSGTCIKSNKYAYRPYKNKKMRSVFLLFIFLLSVGVENYLLKSRQFSIGIFDTIYNFGILLLQFLYTMVCFIMTLFIYSEKPNIQKITNSEILNNGGQINQYCFYCDNYKDEGIEHCYLCNQCFHIRIKHNNFFGCCIGNHNLTAYLVFLVLLIILLLSFFLDGASLIFAVNEMSKKQESFPKLELAITYIMICINFLTLVPLVLMCRQLYSTIKIKKKLNSFLLLKQFSQTTFDSSSTLLARKISLAKELKFGRKRNMEKN